MTVRLYNTLTQNVETFTPLEAGKAKLYVCGTTVQDVAHGGHGRTMTTFDLLARHLRARGYEVTYVRNVTDIDDKILKAAEKAGEEPIAFSARMWKLHEEDFASLGCAAPDFEPKVSETIPEIVALTEKLIERGHAYAVETPKGKDVYFAVRSFPAYGKLSRRNVDDLLSGARIEVEETKRDPLDFALWKAASDDGFGWPSPWGKGRPGWHIECSAMSGKCLGEHFDIHGGGMDLIFPHHENEIAQSEAAYGPELSRFWMHAGFLTIDKEKMAKSLGNFVTVRDVLARNDAEALRYFYLGAQYRGPLNFDVEKLEGGRVTFPGVDEAERRVEYLYTTLESLAAAGAGVSASLAFKPLASHAAVISGALDRVMAALDEDLNTSVALSVVGELAKIGNDVTLQINKLKKDKTAQDGARAMASAAFAALREACAPLGLLVSDPSAFASRTRERRLRIRGLDASVIDAKVAERAAARAGKDFARGDAVRAELAAMGVELLDTGGDTAWRITL